MGVFHIKKSPAGLFFKTGGVELLQLDGGASGLKGGLSLLGLSLGDVLLNGLGAPSTRPFALGQAETSDLAYGLDDVDLLVTSGGEDDGKADFSSAAAASPSPAAGAAAIAIGAAGATHSASRAP